MIQKRHDVVGDRFGLIHMTVMPAVDIYDNQPFKLFLAALHCLPIPDDSFGRPDEHGFAPYTPQIMGDMFFDKIDR